MDQVQKGGYKATDLEKTEEKAKFEKDYLFMNTYTKTLVVVKGAFLGVVLSLMAFWIVPVQVQAQAAPDRDRGCQDRGLFPYLLPR